MIYTLGRHLQVIKKDKEKKIIYKINCSCEDFRFKKIKKKGQGSDIKYSALPCKHLRTTIIHLMNKGYKLKYFDELLNLEDLNKKMETNGRNKM